jgi:hypothetical protein
MRSFQVTWRTWRTLHIACCGGFMDVARLPQDRGHSMSNFGGDFGNSSEWLMAEKKGSEKRLYILFAVLFKDIDAVIVRLVPHPLCVLSTRAALHTYTVYSFVLRRCVLGIL